LIIREKLPNRRDVCVYIYICKYFNILLSASVLFLFCIVMKINKKGRPANIFSSASVSFLNYPRDGLPVDALPRLLVDSHSNLHATADGIGNRNGHGTTNATAADRPTECHTRVLVRVCPKMMQL